MSRPRGRVSRIRALAPSAAGQSEVVRAILSKERRSARVMRGQRHLDDKDAALPRHVANDDLASVGAYRLPGDGESQAEAGSIVAAALPERAKQIARPLRNATALIFNLDEQPLILGAGREHHVAPGRRILEGIVQQVHHG